ncbi:MAG: pentapeptide repeat-containing protein, partial [Alphaproteobacteria bacterium]
DRRAIGAGSGVKNLPERTRPAPGSFSAMLAAHELWITSYGRDGSRLELLNADLSDVVFAELDLSGARFINCDLSRANLTRCKLRLVDMSLSNLQDAILLEADMRAAVMKRSFCRRANFSGVTFASVETGVNSEKRISANLRKSHFQQTESAPVTLRTQI